MLGGLDIASAAGPGIGAGLGAWGGLRFIRWLIEFSCARMDARNGRLDERERALEKRYDARLKHLEDELGRTRRALMLLLNDTASKNPANPVLVRVAELLGYDDQNLQGPISRAPITGDDSLDELIRQADAADPSYVRPGRRP